MNCPGLARACGAGLFVVVALLSPAHAEPSGAEEGARITERPADALLIFELRLESLQLSDGVIGYRYPGGVLLPLGAVSAALDLAITVEVASGRAEGWILQEDRSFTLDVTRGIVRLGNHTEPLPPTGVEAHADDIFVDSELLSRWLPAEFDIEFSRLLVRVRPRETLPIQARLERERSRTRLTGRADAQEEELPEVPLPYRALSMPAFDVSTEYGRVRYGDHDAVDQGRYSVFMTGDLLYMTAEAFLAGDDVDPVSDARLRLGRKDPDGDLLGPLEATEFAVGDVLTPQIPLLTNGQTERGVLLSNFSLLRAADIDRTSLTGTLPLGWEVELYRDGVLLDFQADRGDGLYQFEDVPLLFGMNVFRLVFYGPQGQVREEIERVFIGPGLIRPGEHRYRFSASQRDVGLFDLEEENGGEELRGEGRYSMEYELGLADRLSATAGFASLPLGDGRRTYATAGLRGSVDGVYATADVAREDRGGWAAEVSAQTNVMGLNVLAGHGRFFDFASERENDGGVPLASRSNLRLDGFVPPGRLPYLSFGVEVGRETDESGRTDTVLLNRLGTRLGRVLASNTLRLDLDDDRGSDDALDGLFLVSGRMGSVSLRGAADYALRPVTALDTASVSGDWRIDNDIVLGVDVAREFADGHDTTVGVGLSRIFESVALGAQLRYVDSGDYRGTLSLSFSLGHDPQSNEWAMHSVKTAGRGAVSARVFLDRNRNGRFDAADEPLPGVRLRASGGSGARATDERGTAFVVGLPSHRRSRIWIDVTSIEDPYLVPVVEAVVITPRPAAVGMVEFPVVMTGEIDGTIYRQGPGGPRPLPFVEVELLDARGFVVQRVRAAFDGFYLFERVPPGLYVVRVGPEEATRRNLADEPWHRVMVDGDDPIVSGVDLYLAPN